MKTSTTIGMTHAANKNIKGGLKGVYYNMLDEFKREQTGYASIAIIPQSCIGAVAAMMLLSGGLTLINMIGLFIVTMFCMAYNSAVLAQLKSKTTFNLLILTVVFSSAIIIAHLF